MKVLHLWNTGGVASILAKYSTYESRVLMMKYHDPYDICGCYDNSYHVDFPILKAHYFGFKSIIESSKYDLVHIHAGVKMFYWFHKFCQKKKLVFHYHGSDIRTAPKELRLSVEKYAAKILVSTPDLLDYKLDTELTYLPNPVDTELFARRSDLPNNNRGRCNLKPKQGVDYTRKVLEDFGYGYVDWEFQERFTDELKIKHKITHADMPGLLSNYEYYGDVHMNPITGKTYGVDSKTALEAMALGLKVIRHDGSVSDRLPEKHQPENVARQLDAIYDGLSDN